MKAILQLKLPTSCKKLKSFLGALEYIAKLTIKLSEKTNRMRQLLRKKSDWNWTEKEKEDFNEINKKITEIPCLAHFARDRDKIVSTDSSRTGLGIILWQKHNDETIRPKAFTSRYLNVAERNSSIGEL